MAENVQHLKIKARSISDAIAEMSPDERKVHVTGELAAEYNKLLAMALESRPNLKGVMPPKIAIETMSFTQEGEKKTTAAKFAGQRCYDRVEACS